MASRFDPRRLVLEITETVMLHDTDATLDTLHQLKALGVKRGDRVTFRTPGGGGSGSAAERAPELVARDRRRGTLADG
jgi:N-methylhydantoinase B/oxoprolinase/acetone carboxylase alpha subunit